MKLHIETATGLKFEVVGTNYRYVNGIHYIGDASYPDEIVKKVEGYNEIIKSNQK